ncbi:MAG: hypothetical protein OEY33_09010, partial [Bdellovibrionales bacterium]|nr:hypothetical protein [Bdellovibrionales bacterium]
MSSDIDYRGITLIKFLAVFFMIINHSFVWFLSAGGLKIIHPELLFGDQNQYFYIICNFSMIIPIIAGYNFGKGIHIYCEGDRILNFPFRRVISIFIFLFFIEFLINWLAYGWLTLYHWNALTLIGSGFVFCILLGNISLNLIPLGGIFVLVIYA